MAVVVAPVHQKALALQAAGPLAVVVGEVREGGKLGAEHRAGVARQQEQVRHGVHHALLLARLVVAVVAVVGARQRKHLVVGKSRAKRGDVLGLVGGDEHRDAARDGIRRAFREDVHERVHRALLAVRVHQRHLRGGFTVQFQVFAQLRVLAGADVHGDDLVVALVRERHRLHHRRNLG